MLGGDEAGADPIGGVGEAAHGRGDVEVDPRHGIGQLGGGRLVLGAALGDEVLEHREQQLVLAAEEAVEGLQRDACLLDQLLRREALAALADQATRRGDDGLGLLDLPRARALQRGRPVGGALGPGQRRRRRSCTHRGLSTTRGITRSVRVWYTS